MEEQHKCQNNTGIKGLDFKEGEQRRLCCNNAGNCSPSLEYIQSSSPDNLDKAFELLFEEVIRINKNKSYDQQ